MKICTLVLTYDDPLYNHFDSIKRKYLNSKNADYYFVYNGVDETKNNLAERSINYFSNIQHPSGIPIMFEKFLYTLQSGLIDSYDYIIRVNSSTFINLDVIVDELSRMENNVYMGYFDPGWNFISGACSIFSADVIKKLLNSYSTVNCNREDDVVIGEILSRINVQKTFLSRYNIDSLIQLPSNEMIVDAIKAPQIRIRNDCNRELIDKGIWNMIANNLQLE